MPFRCFDTDLPMWMEIVHGSNVVNDVVIKKLYKPISCQILNMEEGGYDFGFKIIVSNKPLIYQYLFLYIPKYIKKLLRKIFRKY